MSKSAISVSEAAKDFVKILEEVEASQVPTVLTRDGQPVAKIVPLLPQAASCAELSQRLQKIQKLPGDEAEAFAKDIENGRSSLLGLKSAWD